MRSPCTGAGAAVAVRGRARTCPLIAHQSRRYVRCQGIGTGIDPGVIPGPPGSNPGTPGPSISPRQPGGDPTPGTVPDIDPGTPPNVDPKNVPGGVPDPGVGPGLDPGLPGLDPGSTPGVDPGVISPGDPSRL